MDKNIFEDKANIPTENDLRKGLGDNINLWEEILIY